MVRLGGGRGIGYQNLAGRCFRADKARRVEDVSKFLCCGEKSVSNAIPRRMWRRVDPDAEDFRPNVPLGCCLESKPTCVGGMIMQWRTRVGGKAAQSRGNSRGTSDDKGSFTVEANTDPSSAAGEAVESRNGDRRGDWGEVLFWTRFKYSTRQWSSATGKAKAYKMQVLRKRRG